MSATQVAPAKPPKKKTAQEKRRDFDRQRDCEKCQRTCMDCIYLPFFLCASCCCRSWVAKRKEEEHAKAKKHRERRAKAEAEAKAERRPPPSSRTSRPSAATRRRGPRLG